MRFEPWEHHGKSSETIIFNWKTMRNQRKTMGNPESRRKLSETMGKSQNDHRKSYENKRKNNQQWRFPWDLELIFDSQVDEIFLLLVVEDISIM